MHSEVLIVAAAVARPRASNTAAAWLRAPPAPDTVHLVSVGGHAAGRRHHSRSG